MPVYNCANQQQGSVDVGFNLNHNTALKSLSIGFPRRVPFMQTFPSTVQEPMESQELIKHLVPLITSVMSPSLTDLKFMIYMVTPDTLGYIDWEGIDHLLYDNRLFSRVRFVVELYPCLSFSTVGINTLREEQGTQLEAIIYKGLERIARQGRLNVRYAVPPYTALANDSLRSVLDAQFGRTAINS